MRENQVYPILFCTALLVCICLSVAAPQFALVLVLLGSALALIINQPIIALGIYIVMVPFANTTLLSRSLPGLAGLSLVFGYIGAIAYCVILFRKSMSLPKREAIEATLMIILIVIAGLQSIPYARSVWPTHNFDYWKLAGNYYWLSYAINNIVTPILQFLPLILIAALVQTEKHIVQLVKSLIVSLFIFSSFIILVHILVVPDKTNFEVVRATIGLYFHSHGNSIANFYVIGYPLLLAYFMEKKNVFTAATLILSVIGIMLLYSRTAYAIVIISTFLFMIKSGRSRFLPHSIFLLILFIVLAPNTVIDRAMTGIGSYDYTALASGEDITAGRMMNIWEPTMRELSSEPRVVALGGGKFYFQEMNPTLAFKEAHNSYLDMVLKTGLIGLTFMLYYFGRLSYIYYEMSHRSLDKMSRSLFDGVLVSVAAYMIRGITDGSFLPELNNLYIWIVLGLGIAMVKIHTSLHNVNETVPIKDNNYVICEDNI